MSKHVYVIPLWSRVCMVIANYLPSRVRASLYIDMLDSLDDEYVHVSELDDKGKVKSYCMAVTSGHVETLRREAYKDGLHASIKKVEEQS